MARPGHFRQAAETRGPERTRRAPTATGTVGLGQDRPLGQARLLYEIGDGASLRELRVRLGL
ncbi:hypothetical protein ACWDWS_25475, partial [Streptomyces sp. NPDC003328]